MIRTRHLFIALGLAIASLPACMVRGSGSVGVSGPAVVYQEPPAPQVETVSTRPGFLWVHGHWNWQNNQWQWVGGHWERERQGYAWNEGRWERRGSSWHWIDGSWAVSSNATVGAPPVDVSNASGGVVVSGGGGPYHDHDHGMHGGGAMPPPDVSNASGGVVVSGGAPRGMYPTSAPPPLRVETNASRPGFVFIRGRWNWNNGRWDWTAGHWERAQASKVWVDGRWELQGNYYVWVDGRWEAPPPPAAPSGPVIRDHRR
jgi:hypothetical protein